MECLNFKGGYSLECLETYRVLIIGGQYCNCKIIALSIELSYIILYI